MTSRKLRSSRRSRVLVLSVMSGLLMTGCTNAVFDSAAAGALGFVQTGVMTTLSSIVFGGDGMMSASTVMGGMTMSSGGGHGG